MLLQYLMFLATLQGSLVCDIDPKGDHRWTELEEIADRVEVIELGDPQWQGLLDPLRVGDEHTREDLATASSSTCCRFRSRRPWRTEIRRAVQAVVGRPQARQATCLDVVPRAPAGRGGRAGGRASDRDLRARRLARLGFATPIACHRDRRQTGDQHPHPAAPAPLRDAQERALRGRADRPGRPAADDRARHAHPQRRSHVRKVVGFEEAWFLLKSPPASG